MEMETPTSDWRDGLVPPVAFVLSGGASLGSMQVGMLAALAAHGVEPDLVVGTSVGSLNGAVVAQHAQLGAAVTHLDQIWSSLRTHDVMPGGPVAQAALVVRTGYLHPRDGLRNLVRSVLLFDDFGELPRPLTVVAADVLTNDVRWFREGPIEPALLAATALPGVFATMVVDGRHYWDAGPVANVPLQAAVDAGAGSIVVLDTGNVCPRREVPRGIPDGLLIAAMTAMRQRVLIEASAVAEHVPMLYLPHPCAGHRSPLNFDSSVELIEPTTAMVAAFLDTAPPPSAGHMVGAPHRHPIDDEVAGNPIKFRRSGRTTPM